MMKTKLTITLLFSIFLLAVGLQAQTLPQTLKINAGGSVVTDFVSDQGFTGGAVYGPKSQADPGWKAQTGIYSTLRYGALFSYDFPVPNGNCSVQLHFIENRPAVTTQGVPAATIGARVFTVAFNGATSPPIDIFAAAGAQTPYSPPATTVLVTTSHLHLEFRGSVGNAVVSGIEYSCTGPLISVLKCAGNTLPNELCDGYFYIDLVTPGGVELKLIAMPAARIDPAADNPANWTVVP